MDNCRLRLKLLLSFVALLYLVCLIWSGFAVNVQAQSDPAPPVAPVIHAFTINNGDLTTTLHEVTLQLNVTDSQTPVEQIQVRYRNSGGEWSGWELYRAEREWLLSAGDGQKQVDVEVKNQNSHIAKASAAILITVPVSGVTFDYTFLLFHLGERPKALTALIFPEDAGNRDLIWFSDNLDVAVVSEGLVTPVGVGFAGITVTTADGGFSAVCRVEVRAAPVRIDPAVGDGDLNGDGTVDVGDAILVLRSIVEKVVLSDQQLLSADVNLDRAVDVGDAILILRHIVGLVPSLPVGHKPLPAEPTPPPPPLAETASQRLINARYQVSLTAQAEVYGLRVRSGPGIGYQILGTVSTGQRFIIREERETEDNVNKVWYRINYYGRDGWIAARFTSAHNILYGLDFWSNPIRLADAPPGLTPGNYRIDRLFRFHRDENGTLMRTDVVFDFLEQIPYTRLPLERPAPAAIDADFLARAAQAIRPGSTFPGIASSFMRAQELWGVNSLYLMAHAALESNWGASRIAVDKNNLFGFMAFDRDPHGSAATYRSKEDSVLHVSGYIRRDYLNKSGRFYRGWHLAGMNEFYATDPMWAVKIARIMQSMFCYSGYSAVEKELAGGVVTAAPALNLRLGPGTAHPVITTMPTGTVIEIGGVRLVSDTVWVKAITPAHRGWASGDFIKLQTTPAAAVYFFDWFKEGNADSGVNLRQEPGTEQPVTGTFKFGSPLELLAWRVVRAGSDGSRHIWYQVKCPSSKLQGWLRSNEIVIKW